MAKLLEQSTGGRISGDFSINDLRHWRLISTNLLAGTPIVYDSYMRALVLEALDFVADLICGACGFSKESTAAHRVQETVERWAERQDILLPDSYRMPDAAQENTDMPAFARMVIDFGLVYKRRRLHFVLHEINELYANDTSAAACSPAPEDLDLLKIQIHKLIDEMAMYDDSSFLSGQAVAMCRKLFPAEPGRLHAGLPAGGDVALTALVRRLDIECDLARRIDDADAVLSSALLQSLAPHCRSAILSSYLGYFYWDIILRPVVSALSLEAGPIEEVLIDRISPDDALTLAAPEATRMLLGGTFAGFGGFLSRATRENDYLWGRLHAIDRLFDILAGTVSASTPAPIDFHALKKAAFECVIEEEAVRLTLIPDLVARIRAAIAAF